MIYAHGGKRVVDLAIVVLALLVLLPILILTVLLIVLDDGRPVFYMQDRIGKGMVTFRIYKFRSMRRDTASMTSAVASADAITRVGKIIRRTNIDELPQLLNIARGEMSIVGPRPALPSQEVLLSEREASGAFELRPGLTGLAQVRAFDGMSEKEKADCDAQYAENVTFLNDIKIILQTVAYLFRKQPVY